MFYELITFVGPDGSGKTKRVEWLVKAMNDAEIPTKYMRPVLEGHITKDELARLHDPNEMSIVDRYEAFLTKNKEAENLIKQNLITCNVIEDRHSLDTYITHLALFKHFYDASDNGLKKRISNLIPTIEKSINNILFDNDDTRTPDKIIYVTANLDVLDERLTNRVKKGGSRHYFEKPEILKCFLDVYNQYLLNTPGVLPIDTTKIPKDKKELTYDHDMKEFIGF